MAEMREKYRGDRYSSEEKGLDSTWGKMQSSVYYKRVNLVAREVRSKSFAPVSNSLIGAQDGILVGLALQLKISEADGARSSLCDILAIFSNGSRQCWIDHHCELQKSGPFLESTAVLYYAVSSALGGRVCFLLHQSQPFEITGALLMSPKLALGKCCFPLKGSLREQQCLQLPPCLNAELNSNERSKELYYYEPQTCSCQNQWKLFQWV